MSANFNKSKVFTFSNVVSVLAMMIAVAAMYIALNDKVVKCPDPYVICGTPNSGGEQQAVGGNGPYGSVFPPQGNPTIYLRVAAGSSAWQTIDQRFPGRGDQFLVGAIQYLQYQIDRDPALEVRDVNRVPVNYEFTMGSDGAGPLPVSDLTVMPKYEAPPNPGYDGSSHTINQPYGTWGEDQEEHGVNPKVETPEAPPIRICDPVTWPNCVPE